MFWQDQVLDLATQYHLSGTFGTPTTIRLELRHDDYSTVTDLAKFRGWSTLQPRITAM
jgi:hypothetical protein